MRLKAARITKYRSIRDTGLFEIEPNKTILVGPNEAGKTAILQALQYLNHPDTSAGFDPLRDYPRSEYNDITKKHVSPNQVTVVEGHFSLEKEDRDAVPAAFRDCIYVCGRRLDNSFWHRFENEPPTCTYADVKKDLTRLCAHVDARVERDEENQPNSALPSSELESLTSGWEESARFSKQDVDKLLAWLSRTLPHIDEDNATEEARYDRIVATIQPVVDRDEALDTLFERRPIFVLYSNYFRVRPRIHLEHLAQRIESGALDDETYDYGNKCLLELLGFSARELSDLGKAALPKAGDSVALKAHQDQLDKRSYQLDAASVRLTNEIRAVWVPDPKKSEADSLKVTVDGQYLKVVIEDELGVNIELDQRSEGFQWIVSFFVVFFAEAEDKNENAILLLDEPGLSLHGLKQREFRKTLSILAEANQTLYTTHSPFLVGPGELDLVRVVEMTDRKVGTHVHNKVTADDPASLLPLQEALGYDLAQGLFGQRRNLVLEGLTDYWYIEAVAELLRESGEVELNDKVALVPANTAGKVAYFATILHAQKLKVAALLDSDAAGDQAAQQDVLVHMLGNKAILRTKDAYIGQVAKPEIEDLVRTTLLEVAKTAFGRDLSEIAAAQPTRGVIDLFSGEIGKTFSKYKLAKEFVRWTRDHSAADLSAEEKEQWVKLIENINKSLS